MTHTNGRMVAVAVIAVVLLNAAMGRAQTAPPGGRGRGCKKTASAGAIRGCPMIAVRGRMIRLTGDATPIYPPTFRTLAVPPILVGAI